MGRAVHATPRPLYPIERYPVPIVQEARWAQGAIWTGTEISPPQEIDPRSVQPVASRYTDWPILALDIDTIQCFRRLLVTTGNSLFIVMSNASGLLGLSLWTLSLVNPPLKKLGALNDFWWSWWLKFTPDTALMEEVLKESCCCVCRRDSRPFFSNRQSLLFCSSRAMNWGKSFA